MRIKAHICPPLHIPLSPRAFSDSLMNAGRDMESENHPRATTQATGWQAEAPMACGSQSSWRRSKICA